jgi:hypothetical protein
LATFQTDREKRPKLSSRNTGVTKRRKEMAFKIQECEAGTACRHKMIAATIVGPTEGPLFTLELRWQNKRPHKTVKKGGPAEGRRNTFGSERER